MKIILIETVEILDFEKTVREELTVNEAPESAYYVRFQKAEIMQGGCLLSLCGYGNTIDEALTDYCKKIENKRIAFHAFTNKRREVVFPKLIHTKLLRK